MRRLLFPGLFDFVAILVLLALFDRGDPFGFFTAGVLALVSGWGTVKVYGPGLPLTVRGRTLSLLIAGVAVVALAIGAGWMFWACVYVIFGLGAEVAIAFLSRRSQAT
jgi:hypothetical protein